MMQLASAPFVVVTCDRFEVSVRFASRFIHSGAQSLEKAAMRRCVGCVICGSSWTSIEVLVTRLL